VLVVDDDPVSLELLRVQLRLERYVVRTAEDGLTAVNTALAQPPDLVVLDLILPGLGGYDVLRRLRTSARLRGVPIMMITSLNDRRERLRGLALGADDFVIRPVAGAELLARVRSVLARQ
jgi:DNA-binding response OmpR family regulator